MFELRHLRYFTTAARLEHIGKAANELHISQSALSHQIIQLEQSLGIELFDRVGRTVRLTAAGQHFRSYAQQILKAAEGAKASMYELGALNAGEVRVGVFHTFGVSLLPAAISAFHQAHPNVRILVKEGHADQIEAAVAESEVDFGVGFLPVRRANLRAEEMFEDELALVVHEKHRFFGRTRVSLADLCDIPLALLGEKFSMRRMLDAAVAQVGALNVRIEMESVQALLRTVSACADLATVLPRRAVVYEKDLAVVAIARPTVSRRACLLWHKDRIETPAARALAQHVRDADGPRHQATERPG